MVRVLVPTASVHTIAAACDYPSTRLAGADEVVVGPHRGDPERAGDPPGSTVRALLADADRPVTVVPL